MRTKYIESAIEQDEAYAMFIYLRDNIAWHAGVPSRRNPGITRMAYAINPAEINIYPGLVDIIMKSVQALSVTNNLELDGVYLNYYRNGNDYTPNHSHPDTNQIIISLGDPRTLRVSNKNYNMKNGDVIMFGKGIHGVPREETDGARISIALFVKDLNSQNWH